MGSNMKRWVCGLLALVCGALLLCGLFVYAVDPCFYYRIPADRDLVFFNERYQDAGLARQIPADTVVLGTSMVANYRISQIEETFGGTGVKLTVPDGYLSEFSAVLDTVFRNHPPERVLFGLDVNILVRDESGLTGALPEYLYNASPLDDVKYLLNRDTLYYSVYALFADARGEGGDLDGAFTWDEDLWWNHMTALENYDRPALAESSLPADAYLDEADGNLAVIEHWAAAWPDTQFHIFFSPYSLLYWDKTIRQGETDAVFAALERACERLMPLENVRVHGLLMDPDLVADLDHYADYIHHSTQAAGIALEKLSSGEDLLTEENWRQTLANWREFVVNYDYDQFWTDAFWWKWNIDHGASVVWEPGT